MKVCLAGEGAQGLTHIQALGSIEGVDVVTLAGGIAADAEAFAQQWKIPHHSLNLEECLRQPGVEAVILTTPNHLHAAQATLALNMGKHVLVELPMGLSLEDSRGLADLEEKTGLVCMVCHTQRYSPPHREIFRRVRERELRLHHIVAQTYFFRRQNVNRFDKPRTWTDDLLWHIACHTVDFVSYLLNDPGLEAWGQAGPDHPKLGIPMDLTLGLRSKQGCVVSAVLSFNNHGPIDTSYRFIGEENTFFIQRDRLSDYQGNVIPLEGSSFEIQDREFFDAIREGRKPLTSFRACLPTMELLDRIQKSIDSKKKG